MLAALSSTAASQSGPRGGGGGGGGVSAARPFLVVDRRRIAIGVLCARARAPNGGFSAVANKSADVHRDGHPVLRPRQAVLWIRLPVLLPGPSTPDELCTGIVYLFNCVHSVLELNKDTDSGWNMCYILYVTSGQRVASSRAAINITDLRCSRECPQCESYSVGRKVGPTLGR